MTEAEKKKLGSTLKRIEGQVRGIERMLGEDKECEAVLTQITAATASLKSVGRAILADEGSACGTDGGKKEKYVTLLKRFL